MEKNAPLHDYEEWLAFARKASEAGMMFLLLTGGETFLYPHIKELYLGLKKMGIIVSINTNGTLITEEIADYLASDPPRRINITLYGSSNDTYLKLCGNPHGFTQVMRGVSLLQKKNIPIKFNCSVTPYNVNDLEDIYTIAKNLNIPIESAYYMMPSIRQNNIDNIKYRLDPKKAAEVKLRIKELLYSPEIFRDYVIGTWEKYNDYRVNNEYKKGFTCRAGNSVFWVNYDGSMTACSFTKEPVVRNVFECSFDEAWKEIVTSVENVCLSEECNKCHMKILCTRCAAAAYSETGYYGGTPQYHCELTSHFIKLLGDRVKEFMDEVN